MKKIFKNRKLVIATMHQKEKVIAPILEKELGVKCFVLENFDTDKFGTFTREIKRRGDMFQAAKVKLETAMKIANCDLGVASEGSFGENSSTPFMTSNLELILLIDKKNNLEIKGHYLNLETNSNGKYIKTIPEALIFAKKCGFPKHSIIVRKTKNGQDFLFKNIQSELDLKKRITEILNLPETSQVFLETDMRAHQNPTRMKGIALAVQNLVQNIKLECPKCHYPGFVITNSEKGEVCPDCNSITELAKAKIFICQKCKFKLIEKIKYHKDEIQEHCSTCNP